MTNNNDRFAKVTTKMLPMEDIALLLKLNHNFADLSTIGISDYAELAVSEGARDTVKNALNLKKANGDIVLTDSIATKQDQEQFLVYAKELKDLRDEMYQMKAELGRKGIVDNYGDYAGFHEAFDLGDVMYDDEIIAELEEDPQVGSRIKLKYGYDKLDVGDYISIGSEGTEPVIAEVINKLTDSEIEIRSNLSVVGLRAENVRIKKSSAFYFRNSYAFVNNTSDMAGQEYFTSFSDSNGKIPLTIKSTTEGIGMDFAFPPLLVGQKEMAYLSTIDVFLRKSGTPGSLVAYVIPFESLDPASAFRFRGFSDADLASIKHYKSKPLVMTTGIRENATSEFELATFDFSNSFGQFQKIDMTQRYVFVIKGEQDVDPINFYTVRGVTNGDGEIETINKLYRYKKDFYSETISVNTDVAGEILYRLSVRDLIEESVVGHTEGLYTKTFKTAGSTEAKNVRVTMRMNREGFFKFEADAIAANAPVEFVSEGSLNYAPLDIKNIGAGTDYVVAGKNIEEVVAESSRSVRFRNSPVIVRAGDDLHRIGYEIYIKPMKIVETFRDDRVIDEVVEVGQKIRVLPISVVEDRVKRDKRISHRIIFEAEIPDDVEYNTYQLQIVWKTGFANIPERYSEDFYGAIQDLAVSIERRI